MQQALAKSVRLPASILFHVCHQLGITLCALTRGPTYNNQATLLVHCRHLNCMPDFLSVFNSWIIFYWYQNRNQWQNYRGNKIIKLNQNNSNHDLQKDFEYQTICHNIWNILHHLYRCHIQEWPDFLTLKPISRSVRNCLLL